MTRILHLTLHRKWFDEIASGRKRIEYRAMTPYWEKRLLTPCQVKPFDEVHFRNGYHKEAPWMRVEWKGLAFSIWQGEAVYGIKLGEVLEIQRWKRRPAAQGNKGNPYE